MVAGVAARARAKGVPVAVLAGAIGEGAEQLLGQGVCAMFSINRAAQPFSESRAHAQENLALAMENILRLLQVNR